MKWCFLILILSVRTLDAQTFFGPELGMNTSNLRISYPQISYKARHSSKFRAGIVLSVNGDRNVIFQTGLHYYGKGSNLSANYSGQPFASHLVIHSLQLPVYASLQSRPGIYGRFFLGAGAFLDYQLAAREYPGAASALKISFGDDPGELRRLDGGLALQGGYRVNDGVSLRLQYQIGIADLAPAREQSLRSRSFGITIAYLGRSGVPRSMPDGK